MIAGHFWPDHTRLGQPHVSVPFRRTSLLLPRPRRKRRRRFSPVQPRVRRIEASADGQRGVKVNYPSRKVFSLRLDVTYPTQPPLRARHDWSQHHTQRESNSARDAVHVTATLFNGSLGPTMPYNLASQQLDWVAVGNTSTVTRSPP
ncbi:unnamed protein product [Protopolystoma xenopodis]|uniref:Uncharacterized protein n=1 Tax=Protopolystoma xenopodis TaxID=117903 RepID=A0A3S5B665_9PLAT|nr:unnamed protein product [Protopolystoma xenopodis]